MTSRAKNIINQWLSEAGITINGANPWDMQVHDDKIFSQILHSGSLGLGETYMAGMWDCEQLDEFIAKLLKAKLYEKATQNKKMLFSILLNKLFNLQTKKRSLKVGIQHYDVGNNLYQRMLDPTMSYSCGYWHDTDDLHRAQLNKLDLLCRKLQLKKGMTLLDIGCGWGGLAEHAATHYGVKVTGITISKQQKLLAETRCKSLPVTIKFMDYRDVKDTFDRVVSVGMFEHVGFKNYGTFMDVVHRCLEDDGLFVLHTIGTQYNNQTTDPWIGKYIFPNSIIPSLHRLATSVDNRFIMEDWQNFGADYDKTLMVWHKNFTTHWPELKNVYDNTFYRMWSYYLLSCAGAFRARDLQLWQLVLSKSGIKGSYIAPR